MSLAYVFPGQGAQTVGMGKAFYDRFDVSRDLYKRAAVQAGFDVAALCFEGTTQELARTERCQVALLVTSLAAFEAFEQVAQAPAPVGVAGLSLGEWSALVAARALSFAEAVGLVRVRGEAMAECAQRQGGAMLAVIGLDAAAVEEICRSCGAQPANYNAPDQLVLSGPAPAIEKARELATAQGAKRALMLDVAGAFHTELMAPAARELERALQKADIRPPRLPVVSNVTAKPVQEPEEIRRLLVEQIVKPVRWEASVRELIGAGAKTFLEFAPARVLTALLRRIDRGAGAVAINEPADFERVAGSRAVSPG
jgi:[acyl-carrier-protein] S-malonyltransferase